MVCVNGTVVVVIIFFWVVGKKDFCRFKCIQRGAYSVFFFVCTMYPLQLVLLLDFGFYEECMVE